MLTEERTQILEIWRKSGRPAIPLRQGETCFNLEKFLSHPDIRDSDIKAIKAWVQEKEAEVTTDKEKGHCKHGEFNLTEGCPQCIAERRQSGLRPEQDEMEDGLNNEGLTLVSTHQPYHLADSTIVPSVTTVLGILDKPGLLHWAWELGRQGLDYREVRDTAGRVGTLAHHLIACHLKGEAPDYFAVPVEVEKANKCFGKYLAWEKEHPLAPVMVEERLMSEEFKFGGTPDLLAEIDGEFVLIDFKTGGGIYESYFYQAAAYRKLLEEQGWPVAGARILRISPDDSEVEVAIELDHDHDWQIFWHCLGIWELQKLDRKHSQLPL